MAVSTSLTPSDLRLTTGGWRPSPVCGLRDTRDTAASPKSRAVSLPTAYYCPPIGFSVNEYLCGSPAGIRYGAIG
jgi:hypothetical protein